MAYADGNTLVKDDISESVNMSVAEELKLMVSKKDSEGFNETYLRFLRRFTSFRNSLANSFTPEHEKLVPYNPIFDVPAGFALAGSSTGEIVTDRAKKQATALLANGKAAHLVFSAMSLTRRLEFLAILEEKITKHQDDITLAITADTGKPITNAEAEMKKGGQWFSDAQAKAASQLGETGEGKKTKSIEPLGVVQIISAYNYPYALAIGGIVGALTSGNSIVVTPSNKAPNWVFPFMRAAKEALVEFSDAQGVTAKEKNLITNYLIQYSIGVNRPLTDGVDLVHFVGSNAVGEAISESRTKKHKKTILELGGNSVVTVMESALEVADNKGAEGISRKIFDGFAPATGQRCTAPRLVFLQGDTHKVADILSTLCREEAEGHKLTGNPCNPLDKSSGMGPLVDENARRRMDQAIALAGELGAKVNGGRAEDTKLLIDRAMTPGGSCWVNPIAIDWTAAKQPDDAQQAQLDDLLANETFGPLVHIVKHIGSLKEAVDEANKWDKYKLAAAVFTANPQDTETFQHETGITSVVENSGPKDQSPQGPHGHPWLDSIGGESHYLLYTRQYTVKRKSQ